MTERMEHNLIRKCADGELTSEECAGLLRAMDQSATREEWRHLALTFIENQELARAFAARDIPAPPAPRPAPEQTQKVHWSRRQMGPLASIAAALCVGVLSGLAGYTWWNSPEGLGPVAGTGSTSPAANPAAATPQRGSPRYVAGPVPGRGGPAPVMNVRLAADGDPRGTPLDLPVYSEEHWPMVSGAEREALPSDLQQLLESRGLTLDREQQWYRARLDDGQEILVPTETVRVRHAMQ